MRVGALILLFAGGTASAQTAPEVHVNGVKSEPTAPRDSMRAPEIREVPGAFGDALRAVESLPGVTPIVSGLPYFFMRGAPPGNTGFFIDGIRVPGLFHLGVGPAVLYPAVVERVDVYKSAYPVRFGRFAGGIIAAEIAAPTDRMRTDWTLRLFDAGALVEAPLGNGDMGSRGSVLASGRYGYPGLLLTAFSPNMALSYWDYQARASYNVTDRDTVSVFAFGSYDVLKVRQNDALGTERDLDEVLGVQFHRVDLRWDRKTSATGSIRTALTIGYDQTSNENFAARAVATGARVLAKERLGSGVSVRGGADVWSQSYDLGVKLRRDAHLAAWVDVPMELAPRVLVTPGLRSDIFTSRGLGNARALPALDPRITTRIGIGPIEHIGAVGIATQPSTLPLPIPALDHSDLRRGLQRGYQMSQGIEAPLPWGFTAKVTGFLHTYVGLIDLAVTCDDDDAICETSRTRGRSMGLEMMLKRSVGRFRGWISYTLSRSRKDAWDALNQRHVTVAAPFDRTHVLDVVLTVDLGRGFHIGGRYAGYSGVPYSTIGNLAVPNARTPAFHRIDARAEKRWYLGANQRLAVTIEMFNVLLMKEYANVVCVDLGDCRAYPIGPISIPSIGFEGTF